MSIDHLRVYELAKELKKTSQQIIDLLKENNIPVKGYLTDLDKEACNIVRKAVLGEIPEEIEEQKIVETKPVEPIIVEQKKQTKEIKKEDHDLANTYNKASGQHDLPDTGSKGANQPIKHVEAISEKKPIPATIEKPKAIEQEKPKKKEEIIDSAKTSKASKPVIPQEPKKQIPVAPAPVTVLRLSKHLGISIREIEIKLLKMGILASSPKDLVPLFAIKSLSELYGIHIDIPEQKEVDLKYFIPRAPVITIMGHVDHGKTTLLDTMRKAHVAEKELGGITQAIGAYSINYKGKQIIFIDTPGHEAFTAMRAKGSEITDIVVLVVAADDGVKEQTIEAINHAKAAKVPIIVAMNKIDRPGANLDLVKSQLSERGLAPEEWGGDTIFVPISAKNNVGIDDLLEMILLKAEMMELKTNAKAGFAATVIESNITKTFGAQATIIIQTGTLKVGDVITNGKEEFKVRVLYDDRFKPIKSQIALAPVNIQGIPVILKPGSILKAAGLHEKMETEVETGNKKTEELDWESQFLAEKVITETVTLIVKADGEGTLDAVSVALNKLEVPGVTLKIVHSGVGMITDNDILLATVSNAKIVGFNVTVAPSARKEALIRGVSVNSYRIIFELIDDVTALMKGILEPEKVEQVIGTVEVKAIFKTPRAGTIAGCIVRSGIVVRNAKVRIIRNRSILLETQIESLRRFKDDVKEVREGFECGIGLENFNDIKVGDTLEVFKIVDAK
jgi:translation initiation factor IF-2